MRIMVTLLVVATSAVLAACHSTLSPEKIDEIERWCHARPYDPSKSSNKSVAFRANGAPPGTPVVIYGASWCAACDATAAYLTRRHIPFVDKDIEHDEGAAAEMRSTLAAAGFAESDALPVVDVRGTVTLGFFPCVVETAWAAR